jgi:hypothetical protein
MYKESCSLVQLCDSIERVDCICTSLVIFPSASVSAQTVSTSIIGYKPARQDKHNTTLISRISPRVSRSFRYQPCGPDIHLRAVKVSPRGLIESSDVDLQVLPLSPCKHALTLNTTPALDSGMQQMLDQRPVPSIRAAAITLHRSQSQSQSQ